MAPIAPACRSRVKAPMPSLNFLGRWSKCKYHQSLANHPIATTDLDCNEEKEANRFKMPQISNNVLPKKKKEKMILESGIQIKPLFRFEKCSRQCSEEMGQDFPDMPPSPHTSQPSSSLVASSHQGDEMQRCTS